MDDHQKMRASDADRQRVIERLRTALDEGRLKMDEYLERMGQSCHCHQGQASNLASWLFQPENGNALSVNT